MMYIFPVMEVDFLLTALMDCFTSYNTQLTFCFNFALSSQLQESVI